MVNEINDGGDKVDPINRGDRTSENTSTDSIIGGDRKDHQQIHQEASKAGQKFETFSDNDDDQSMLAMKPSETLEQYQTRLAQRNEQKAAKPEIAPLILEDSETGEVFYDARTSHQKPTETPQEVLTAAQNPPPEVGDSTRLLASNVAPNVPNLDQMRQDVQTNAENHSALKHDVQISHYPGDFHTSIESGEVLRPALEAGAAIGKTVIESGIEAGKQAFDEAMHPYRGKIDFTMKQIPESAWGNAYDAFPQFKEAGLSKQQAIEVMKAIVRNELYYYDAADKSADDDITAGETPLLAKMHYKPKDRITLGLPQLSIAAVHEREAEYPKQVNFKGREQEALMDPANTPLLVAATLVHNLEMYQRHHIPITEQSLGYSYNPPAGRLLPTQKDLDTSEHAANVMHQLAIIRGQIEAKPDER